VTTKEPAWVAKADRAAILVVSIGAALTALIIVAAFVTGLVQQLSTGTMQVTLLPYSPVPESVFAGGVGVESAVYTEAEVVTRGLSSTVVGLYIAGHALGAATGVIVALALAFMGWRLLKGDPFRRSVVWSSLTAAVALITLPLVGLLLTTIANTIALTELVGTKAGTDGLPFRGELELTPVLVGIGLAVVLGVFEYGQKLEADTKGLV
jgi:hypothetical protein